MNKTVVFLCRNGVCCCCRYISKYISVVYVVAILWLQIVVHVMLFPMLNDLYFNISGKIKSGSV
jgi:hypothetical protein